jgi:hypothetical protein
MPHQPCREQECPVDRTEVKSHGGGDSDETQTLEQNERAGSRRADKTGSGRADRALPEDRSTMDRSWLAKGTL